jgi:hypothetical protein
MTLAASPEQAAAAVLAERLNDPVVAASLVSILNHADLLALLVVSLDGFVARSEVIGDSLIASLGDLRSTVENNEALAEAGIDLRALKESATTLLASDLFKPETLEELSVLARGVGRGNAEFAASPVAVGGIFSLGKLLKDPDINRALSFAATVAKAVGQELKIARTTSTNSPTS